MSNSSATANVIPMRDFDRPAPSQQGAQFERLLKECQDLALGRLETSLGAMLDKAGDTLWELANSIQDRETRDLYLAAKDTALAQRKTLEEEFHARYLSEFQSRTERTSKQGEEFSKYDLSSLELNLVAEDDLDETLKTNEMAAKLRRYCDEELVALDQRVGVLIGDATLQGEANPFSPQAICNAFRQACQHVEPNQKVRMVFHRLFDDHVLDDIRSIYKDLNSLLVQRSILPKIRYGMQRGAGGTRAGAALAAAALGAGAVAEVLPGGGAGTGDGPAAGGNDQDFFAVLQNLMGLGAGVARQITGPRGPATGADAGSAAVQIPGFPPILGAAVNAAGALEGAELLGSLTRIQHGDLSAIAAGNLPLAANLIQPGTTNVLRELKGTAFGSGLGQLDSMTLDIVSMLFDQIFDDRKIPSAMKGLIGRLQIPMLKVAILDKEFFSRRAHPARQLLDTLGEVALWVPPDFGTESPLYLQLESVIQRLIDGFQDSIEIFDALREELEELLEAENGAAEEEARQTAQQIEQKEKLGVAKAVAQEEILQRARAQRIPSVVLKFLAGQWVKLLLVTHAKHGPDSEPYKTALATMDALIWSVIPKASLEERRELASRLPSLLKRVNAGMQIIGTDEPTRRTFFTKLLRCHTKIINGTATATTPGARATASAATAATSATAATATAPTATTTAPAPAAAAANAAPAAPANTKPATAARAAADPTAAPVNRAAGPDAPAAAAAPAKPATPAAAAMPATPAAPAAAATPATPTAPAAAATPATPAAPAAAATPATPAAPAAAATSAKPAATVASPAPAKPAAPTAAAASAKPAAAVAPPAPAKPAAPAAPAAAPVRSSTTAAVAPAATEPPILDDTVPSLDFSAGIPTDADTEPTDAPPEFTQVTVVNPFGEGEIEVEEISLSELPGATKPAPAAAAALSDDHRRLADVLTEGVWVEFTGEDGEAHPARLAYISPIKGTYLFVNRQGKKVADYSLHRLLREFRNRRAALLVEVPLFDRAMTSLVGVLKGADRTQ
jgi:hypothetical protein